MANPFLLGKDRDIETALLLEKAIVHDIGKAIAFTDGEKIYINTDDNLEKLLPNYCVGMQKWLLRHEKMHIALRHHARYFKYLTEARELSKSFNLTKDEVNIIMDILVHDSMSKMFPELVEIAISNLAQMRNRNSLSYTFKTYTLEDMLDEYARFKHAKDEDDKSKDGEGTEDEDDSTEGGDTFGKSKSKSSDGGDDTTKDKPHKKVEDTEDTDTKDPTTDDDMTPGEHDMTDWSLLEGIDTKEFLSDMEVYDLENEIQKLKNTRIRLASLTQTLNGLVTGTRKRTYAMPSTIYTGGEILLKGSRPSKATLYLCFDASGSMGHELETFKYVIENAVPQAMTCPCEWFTDTYGKGQFRDIMKIHAFSGFSDDFDRLIELCYKAEQKGYSPIGVADGGGGIRWSRDMLVKLQRTILVGPNYHLTWLNKAKEINPKIQVLGI